MNGQTRCVKSNLGLVCITASEAIRFKTVTRKRLFSFDEAGQRELLTALYVENIARLRLAIEFCSTNKIRLYRMTSALFPFSDEPFGAAILAENYGTALASIGQTALDQGIRLLLHPDQYVVLNSDSEAVIENSIKVLQMHANTMDLLGQPRSEWAAMIIHGGKSERADKMVETIRGLPAAIRLRLVLENDEHAYSSQEILEICQRAGVPMVFDAHHHIYHEQLDDYNHPSVAEYFWAARATWAVPENQIVHISNGRERFLDRAHSDLIFTMPDVFRFASWIEVEAKSKELAIEKLQKEWAIDAS
ncbi:MAG: UV DNA damage repair endonuclease UvsE [Caldilineaceae bacterium]